MSTQPLLAASLSDWPVSAKYSLSPQSSECCSSQGLGTFAPICHSALPASPSKLPEPEESINKTSRFRPTKSEFSTDVDRMDRSALTVALKRLDHTVSTEEVEQMSMRQLRMRVRLCRGVMGDDVMRMSVDELHDELHTIESEARDQPNLDDVAALRAQVLCNRGSFTTEEICRMSPVKVSRHAEAGSIVDRHQMAQFSHDAKLRAEEQRREWKLRSESWVPRPEEPMPRGRVTAGWQRSVGGQMSGYSTTEISHMDNSQRCVNPAMVLASQTADAVDQQLARIRGSPLL